MSAVDRDQLTAWLASLADGTDQHTLDQLMAALYPELRQLAERMFRDERAGHTLQPTALVHEAYLRLIDQTRVGWESSAHFKAIAARVMRRVLIDHARGRARQRRSGQRNALSLDSEMVPAEFTQAELLLVHDALEKLATLDQRQARVVELRIFGGMTVAEVAEALHVSKRTVEDDWTHAKAWLRLVFADGTDS
jgi:RNA polymerase sigma factor (TIGR02999 family)